MQIPLITINVKTEFDVVAARLRARQIAALCGFGNQDQVRIATSVSEIARNAVNYAGGGSVKFLIEGETSPQILNIIISDRGPGIKNLEVILSGAYQSSTGMGKGILGAKKLMDKFDLTTSAKGTHISFQKIFPRDALFIDPKVGGGLVTKLSPLPAEISASEILEQNQDLLLALTNLKAKQDELVQLTRELEDTNRGVVALYAELDEKADHLRRADEMKSRFLSNMSHEFRTPLSSIRALGKLLLDRIDGELTDEQEKQVRFIMHGALGLTDLVNDLLDIAKIEAGRTEIYPQKFSVTETFSTLRGMLKPLLITDKVALHFIDPEENIKLDQDEAKLSQILRNFISNALKFTETGSISISAELIKESNLVRFSVSDTGIGIDKADISLIFEEFGQVASPLQRRLKGTGLGLPLCKKLATLLNGEVTVESTVGVGSTFSVTIPVCFEPSYAGEFTKPHLPLSEHQYSILIVEDNPHVCLLYDKFLSDSEFQVIFARTVREAKEVLNTVQLSAIILDVVLFGEYAWSWLAELKNEKQTENIPVIVATEINDKRKGLSLGANAYFLKPIFKHQLLSTLRHLLNISAPLSQAGDEGLQ